MKRKITSAVVAFSAGALLLSVAGARPAAADWGGREDWQVRRHERHRQFMMGACVGQTLAQQGVSLPVPVRGQPQQPLDQNTQAALQAAIQSCRAQMDGQAQPSPNPSAEPSGSPVASPTMNPTAPIASPNPVETGTSQ